MNQPSPVAENTAPRELPLPRSKARTTFESLRNRDFRVLWIGNLASSFAMNMQQIARGWLIYAMTESAMALTWVTLSFMIPQTVLALFGGVLADRLPKRRIIIAAQSLNCIATIAMAATVLAGSVTFWHFIVFGVVNGSVLALSMPARQAFIPEIVGERRLFNAMALNTTSWNLSRVLGPVLAGVLIGLLASGDTTDTFGVGIVFLVIAGLYATAAITASFVRRPGKPNKGTERGSPLSEVGDGLRYVWEDRIVFGLILLSIMPFLFGMPMISLLPAFNQDILAGGPDTLGVINGTMGVGAILGSLYIASMGDARHKGLWQFSTCAIWGLGICLFSMATWMVAVLALIAVIGFASSVFMSMNRSLIQLRVSPEMRGRVMSIDMMSHGLMPIGIIPIGWIAEAQGIDIGLLFSGILLSGITFVLLFALPGVRRIDTGHETAA